MGGAGVGLVIGEEDDVAAGVMMLVPVEEILLVGADASAEEAVGTGTTASSTGTGSATAIGVGDVLPPSPAVAATRTSSAAGTLLLLLRRDVSGSCPVASAKFTPAPVVLPVAMSAAAMAASMAWRGNPFISTGANEVDISRNRGGASGEGPKGACLAVGALA